MSCPVIHKHRDSEATENGYPPSPHFDEQSVGKILASAVSTAKPTTSQNGT